MLWEPHPDCRSDLHGWYGTLDTALGDALKNFTKQ
jgi:hypothetical protein